MDTQAADVWLLTEVHRDWNADSARFAVSPPRSVSPAEKRWSGIWTRLPLGELRTSGSPGHAGEEGLCLARLRLGASPSSSVLVACSVLPWKGAGKYWRGLPPGQADEFRHVLDHHVARIAAERRAGEPLVWGGDFNQPLKEPFWASTRDGAVALRSAFAEFGLVALTEDAEHLNGTSFAIDHLAVSAELLGDDGIAAVHRPAWDGGLLSDHAAYTADLRLPTTPAVAAGRAAASQN